MKRIHIVRPVAGQTRTGNRGTANQWRDIFSSLGYEVSVGEPESDAGPGVDLLIALHGQQCHDAVVRFQEKGSGKLVVALTGTDIYPEPDEETLDSIARADRVIILQPRAREKVPPEHRGKVRCIIQSVEPATVTAETDPDHFDVCVVGHLREVKDPLRAAEAARLLPESSRIRIRQAGGILEEKYRDLVAREEAENPRYQYLGELDEAAVAELVGGSRVLVISSFSEGGARVAGEAIASGTPVISSKIDGVAGLVGDDSYPGFFPVGDTRALAGLLEKLESDSEFRDELKQWTGRLAPKFDPALEAEKWKVVLAELS